MTLLRYVALGDSTGVGVGASGDGGYPERLYRKLKASGLPAGILNLCQSGATTRDLIDHTLARAVAKAPALVTVGIGTNDLWRMVPLAVFEKNLEAIADALERSGAEVVVSNLIDLSLAPVGQLVETVLHLPRERFHQRVEAMNVALGALARRPRFSVVDLHRFSAEELPRHPEYFSDDGFHPSARGYDRWAELLWPQVEQAARRGQPSDTAKW